MTLAEIDSWDRELLQLLLANPQFVEQALAEIHESQLHSNFTRKMFGLWRRMLSEGMEPTFQNVMLEIQDQAAKTLIVELDEAALHGHEPAKHVTES
jgi:hypothetical protein